MTLFQYALTRTGHRAQYTPASPEFASAVAEYVTRGLLLGECAGPECRMEADAYMMGGEL